MDTVGGKEENGRRRTIHSPPASRQCRVCSNRGENDTVRNVGEQQREAGMPPDKVSSIRPIHVNPRIRIPETKTRKTWKSNENEKWNEQGVRSKTTKCKCQVATTKRCKSRRIHPRPRGENNHRRKQNTTVQDTRSNWPIAAEPAGQSYNFHACSTAAPYILAEGCKSQKFRPA